MWDVFASRLRTGKASILSVTEQCAAGAAAAVRGQEHNKTEKTQMIDTATPAGRVALGLCKHIGCLHVRYHCLNYLQARNTSRSCASGKEPRRRR
jgi:hypothetical protein